MHPDESMGLAPSSAAAASGRPAAEPYPLLGESRARMAASAVVPRVPAPRPAVPRRSYRAEGCVCLLVAAAWAIGAQVVYDRVGTIIFMRGINQALATGLSQMPAPGTEPGAYGPRGGTPPRRPTLFPTDVPPMRSNAVVTPPAVPPNAYVTGSGAAPTRSSRGLEPIQAEATRVAWAILTYAIIGLLVIGGLAGLVRTTARRMPIYAMVCVTFGICAGALAAWRIARPSLQHDGWQGWLDHALFIATQSRVSWAWHLMIASGAATLVGMFALRPDRSPRGWLMASAIGMIAATLLTLLGISVLETFARLPAMPSWVYVCVAFAQSLFGWLIMLMLDRRSAEARIASNPDGFRKTDVAKGVP